MAGYSGTPLVRKLGIAPKTTLALIGAPAEFRGQLVDMPDDVKIVTRAGGEADLVICFVRSASELNARILPMRTMMRAGLWFAWPKKSSGVRTDLTET